MSLKTRGFPETMAGMAQLRELVAEKAVRSAVRAGAQVIAIEMAAQAPILDHKTDKSTALEPRALKDGIRVNRVEKLEDGIIQALIGPRRGTRRVAHDVEYGHRLVKGGKSFVDAAGVSGPGREIGDVPKHPFLRPAYEASWQASLAAYAAELKLQLGRFLK